MKKVAMVGMAHTTRDFAPWDDLDTEIWTLNESPAKRFGYVKRVSRHFQLHAKWNYDRDTNQNDPEHRDWLRAQTDFPIYMQEVDPDVPMSVKYPWEEVCEFFKINPTEDDHWKEFTSTFPYMLALAMLEGFDQVEVYGFEMGSETEYAYQRSSAHLFLGIMRGYWLCTGKPEIIIPNNSRLLGWGMPRYGFDMMLGINPMELEIDRNRFRSEEKRLQGDIAGIQGAQDEIQNQIKANAQQTQERINEINAKKSDPKLKEKRIKQVQEEHNVQTNPLIQRLRELDSIKLEKTQELNYVKGMGDNCDLILGRINSQRVLSVSGPDKTVKMK